MFIQKTDYRDLVQTGQETAQITLNPLLADLLVATLENVQREGNDITRPLTVSWYQNQGNSPSIQQTVARKTGDACLVMSGFFPQFLKRREIIRHHYVQLGQSAYYETAMWSISKGEATLYMMACRAFLQMVRVLYCATHHH